MQRERTVLITGAAGFIGSSLAERLAAEGHRLVGLDNFDDYYDPAAKARNVRGLLESGGLELVRGDIRDAAVVDELFGRHRFDAVVHLAARAGVRPSIELAPLYCDVNVTGTTRLLEAAVRHRVEKFLFASSSSVYGARSAEPFREDDPVDEPVSPYAATKRAGELICRTFHGIHGLAIDCLRFFTVYGPRQRPEMAIHAFTRAIDRGDEITVYGDGSAQRDFTYIDDIVSGITGSLATAHGFRIFNLGGGETVTVLAMIRAIEEALGKRARIRFEPEAPGDVPVTFADVSRARAELGYEPRVHLPTGVPRFVEWYRKTYAAVRDAPPAPAF